MSSSKMVPHLERRKVQSRDRNFQEDARENTKMPAVPQDGQWLAETRRGDKIQGTISQDADDSQLNGDSDNQKRLVV